MRFEKLVLRRFGHFTDFELDLGKHKPGEPDLHVLYGPNEAGKSTTLAAISDLLYGIATRTPWNFQHANDMLELEAVVQQGAQELGIKRFKNHWADASNNRLARFPLDLQGLSREDYVRRFSFDEQTLQDGGEQILNSNGDVGQALFSASAGLANLKQTMDAAMADANAFWMPKRTKNIRITELKKALQENKQRSDAVKLDVRQWKKRCETLEHATLRRDKYRKDRDELQETLRKLDLQKAAGAIALQYTRLTQERQELEAAGVIALNHTTALDVSTAVACRQALEQVRSKLEENRLTLAAQTAQGAQLTKLQEQLLTLTPSAPALLLVQAADRIRKLSEEKSADDDWRQQQAELQSTVAQCDVDLNAAHARLGLAEGVSLEQALPGDAVLSELNELLVEEQALSARLLHAQEELDKLQEHPQAEVDSDDQSTDFPDTSIASDVLRRVHKEGLAQQLIQARESLLESRRAVLVNAERLNIASEQISKLDLPEAAWLNARLSELSDLRSQATQLAQRIASQRQDILKKQNACEKLTLAGAVDPATIADARQSRDESWQAHSAALDDEQAHSALQKSARQFGRQMQHHDELLARAASSSQASAELQLLQSQLVQQQEELDELCQVQQAELAVRTDSCVNLIRSRVASFHDSESIDIEVLRERHTLGLTLREAHIECESRALAMEALQQRCSEQSRKLLAMLAPVQTPAQLDALTHLDLEDLIAHAEKTLELARERSVQLRDRHLARQTYLSELDKRTETRDTTLKALKSWQEKWHVSTTDSVFASLSLPQARDTLTWIASVRPQLTNRHEAARKLELLNARITARDTAIQTLLQELELGSLPEALNLLTQATQQTQDHARVQKEMLVLDSQLAQNRAAHAQNLENIKSLRLALEVDSDEALLELLSRTEQHCVLSDRRSETLQQLREITGNASLDDENVARLCDDSMDVQALTQQMQTLRSQLAEASSSYDEANQAWALANSAVEKIDTDGEYARLVQERTTLLLETADLARQTATARTGQLVLKAAMARFRQEHQSVILTAAQQAFTTLTGGHYVQLVPRDDGRGNERLFVIDDQDNARSVSELSTGTRYQLYLALRAAAHADYATQRQPLPFVADDIMESFDDDRSAAAFTVLGTMAEKGQVIYLTHHQHLLDIVREVMGADRVTVHRFQ